MAITRTRSSEKCSVIPLLITQRLTNLLFSIKELELKSSNIDGRLQEREDEYSRK